MEKPRPPQITFFAFTWLHMLWVTHGYFELGTHATRFDLNYVFHLSAWPFYSLLYLVPAAALAWLTKRMWPAALVALLIGGVLTTALTLLLIHTDRMIYDLYSFHINSFVLNLIFTPGGISSLGSGLQSYLSLFLLCAQVLLIQGILMWLALRQPLPHLRLPGRASISIAVLALFLVQGTVYGISDIGNFGPVLDSSRVYPLFQRVRFRALAATLGFDHDARAEFTAHVDRDTLNYPQAEIEFVANRETPNIIMLVAESLRWDQLNARTMPETWAFSRQGLRFANHYSSGNGTREGLFGMFYGLYGAYWENFMHARQSPLLMDRLQALNYQLDIRTSASFTYPEFEKTLFVNVPSADLHTVDSDLLPWRRDEANTDALLRFLDTRDPDRPFMEFLFFESTHASYYFPEATALTEDYQDDVDYTELSRKELAMQVAPLYNRYRNAAHWVDIQLGRIYRELEVQGLLHNTIVIITGDHGEEFMERNAWGHNSAFVEEQTHVPLVVLMPGNGPTVIERLTNHIDIATTLLQSLGAVGDSGSYSLGSSLLDAEGHDYIVISDWHSIAVMTETLKYRIPYLNTGADFWLPTSGNDELLSSAAVERLTISHRNFLLEAMANCTVFAERPEGLVPSGGG